MASQEFLASFAVDIDEGGVSRLQSVLEENRDLANEVAAAFSAATAAILEYQDAASGNTGGTGESNRDTGSGQPAGNTGTKTGTNNTAEPDRTGWHYVEEYDRWMPNPDTAMKNLAQLQLSGVLTGDNAPAVPTTARELVLQNLETMYLGQASRDSANASKKLISWEDIGLSSDPTAREGYSELMAAAQDLIREPMEQAREYMKQAIEAEEAGQDGSEYIQMVDEVLRKPLEQVKEMVDNFDFGDESSGTGKGGTDGESGSELDLDTAAAEESLEAFREKASEPISVSLDASDSLGEGNDQSGKLNMDLTEARANLESFRKDASKPVSMSGNASGMVSAARSAYNSIKSLFSTPITIKAKVEKEGTGDGDGSDSGGVKMSKGGRFSKPTDVQVAEDGDAEYIIPVKKENRAVPLLKQLLSELSPEARASLAVNDESAADMPEIDLPDSSAPEQKGTEAEAHSSAAQPVRDTAPADAARPLPAVREVIAVPAASQPIAAVTGTKEKTSDAGASGLLSKLSDVLSASLHETTAPVVQNTNQNVSAPVTIQVRSNGTDAEQVGQKLYDTTERYLLRTLKGVFA